MVESPSVTLDQDGIIMVDYGNLLVTAETLRDGLLRHRALAPGKKSKVLIQMESSTKLDTEVTEFGTSAEVIALTTAVALIPHSKIGRILTNLYLKINRNPYPTRAFDTVQSGKAWLLSLD